MSLLDLLADDVIVRVTKKRRHLPIGIVNDAARINDDHRVGRRVQCTAGKL